MESVGKLLYAARISKGLTLAEVEKEISIRASYLEALEHDNYEKLPEEVFIKGIIRNYGNFLGLNGPELVNLYKADKSGTPIEEVQSKGIREVENVKMNINLKQTRSAGSGTNEFAHLKKKNFKVPFKQIFVGIIALCVLAGGYFAMPKAMEWLHKSDETATVEIKEEIKTSAPTVAPVVEKIVVDMTAYGDCWLEVKADGKEIFAGMLRAKDTRTYEANDKLIIKYGNVGVMQVNVNGKPEDMSGLQGVAVKTYTR